MFVMRTAAIAALLVLSMAAPAAAQHSAEVEQVHTLTSCISEHHTHLTRLTRLLDEADTRLHASDESVRRDAALSVETLLQRAAEAREELRACIEAADFVPPSGETVEHTTTPDDAADHVAVTGGSIHEVEANTTLTTHVRVVRGERVDGSGSVSDASLRSAVRSIGHAVALCYEGYVDRATSHSGSVHVSFTIDGTGQVTAATVERGGFDAPLRTCVQRAFRLLSVPDATGTSVYAYELALGP